MKETNNVIYSNERSTHIYDDVVDLQQNNDVIHRTMRKSVTARISHHYERLIGIARTKENRMCVFGIVSTVIAIVSLTVAVVFSVLYAKTQHCKNATNGELAYFKFFILPPPLHIIPGGGNHGDDRNEVGFPITCAISVYHH